MKVSDFKQRVANKMFMSADADAAANDMTEYRYDDKIGPTFHECLVMIANSTLPCRKIVECSFVDTFTIRQTFEEGSLIYSSDLYFTKILCQSSDVAGGVASIVNGQVVVNLPGAYVITCKVRMTYTFDKTLISVLYADTEVKGASFSMLTDRIVKVTKPGDYTFVINCYYPDVDFTAVDDELPEDIPESVAAIAVLYVASQLLYDTDQVKAAQIRNEFELALARLDIDRQDLQEHFSIVSRW